MEVKNRYPLNLSCLIHFQVDVVDDEEYIALWGTDNKSRIWAKVMKKETVEVDGSNQAGVGNDQL